MKRLLNKSWNGAETWMHHDGETIQIERKQDVSALLDLNKKIRNEFQGYADRGDHHFHLYARIPPVVIEKWRNELGIDVFNEEDAPRVQRLLNSNEYQFLRTTEGWI
jgi:hypothetical protein